MRVVPRQLTLRVSLSDHASFDNFLAADNVEAVHAVRDFAECGIGSMFVYGVSSCGKTHLLYAAQKSALSKGRNAGYFSLRDSGAIRDPGGLVDNWDLVCVDDVEVAAGRLEWESLLFSVIERQRQTGGALLAAGNAPVRALGFSMQDLASRLAGGPCYRLRALNDEQKKQAMRLRARLRGFELPDEVTEYIMKRFSRDAAALFSLLDRIDQASLSTHRRITVALVKGLETR